MAIEGECVSLLRRSYQESSRDFIELSRMDLMGKKRMVREIEVLYSTAEKNCADNLSPQVLVSALSNLKLAQLRIALAIRNDPLIKNLNDPDLKKIMDSFTVDEYSTVEKLERFSKIDSLNSQSLTILLVSKDDQIYRMVKEWYNENMEDFLGTIDLLSGKDVRGELAKAMEEKYRNRFQKLTEGIVNYVQQDPGQIRKLFVNYENSMKNALRIESTRVEARRKIMEIMSGEELENFHDLATSIILLGKAKNLVELGNRNVEGIIRSMKGIESRVREAIADLEDERGKLENDPEMRANSVLKDIEKNRLDELIDEGNIHRRTILDDIGQLENLKTLAMLSSSGVKGSYGSDYSCTFDEVILRKDTFYESTVNSLKGTDGIPIYVPRYNFKGTIKRKALDKSIERLSEERGFWDSPRQISLAWSSELVLHRLLTDIRISLMLAYVTHDKVFEQREGNVIGRIDETPFNIEDLVEIYSSLVQASRDRDSYYLCIIGSPNGFSRDVIEMVNNETGKGLASTNVLVVLRDMKNGSVFYDAVDDGAKALASLLSSGQDLGRVNYDIIRGETLAECRVTGVVRLKTICKVTGLEDVDASRAWKKLEGEGLGKVDSVNGEPVFRISEKGAKQ